MTTRALIFVVLVVALPSFAEEDAAAFLARTMEVYGGVKALSAARAVKAVGSTVSSTRHPGQTGAMVRTWVAPARLKVEVAWGPGDVEVRVVDGDRGWRDGEEVVGPMLEAMQLQAARLGLPLALYDGRTSVRDLGVVEREGKKVRVFELPLSRTMSLSVEIDVATHRLVRSIGRAQGAMPLEFITSYADYRLVNGLLFAFTEKNLAMGRPTGDSTFEKIEVVKPEAFGP